MPKPQRFILDANFFISMLQIKARNILGNLDRVAKELDYQYYMSEVVFDEIKAPHTYRDKLRQIINIREVLPIEIDDIKIEFRVSQILYLDGTRENFERGFSW